MSKRIEYKEGDVVGNNGCIFIEELEKHVSPAGNTYRKAVFECGNCGIIFSTHITHVKSNHTESCGCIQRERTGDSSRVHGLSSNPLYFVWQSIKDRCYNHKNKDYHNYGGRGITMYGPWRENARAFYDYITQLPNYGEPDMTIDRENNDKGYVPGNLRWADRLTQAANRRTTKICLTN